MTENKTPQQMNRVPERSGFVRIYNTHETQAFRFHHNSNTYVIQPKQGEFKLQRSEERGLGAKKTKSRPVTHLVKVSDKKCPNFLTVPYDLAKKVLEGEPRMKNAEGEIDEFHHGGFVKRLEAVEAQLDSDFMEHEDRLAALQKKHAEIEAELARKQEMLDRLSLEPAAPRGKKGPASAPPPAGDAS